MHLIGYLPSHIQRALVEYMLIIPLLLDNNVMSKYTFLPKWDSPSAFT